MFNLLKRLFCVISGSQEVAANDIPSEIRVAVLSFIQARNDAAIACSKIDEEFPPPEPNRVNKEGVERLKQITREHAEEWYASGVDVKAFSQAVNYEQDAVRFLSALQKRGRWIVKTEQRRPAPVGIESPPRPSYSEFEYHLVSEDGKWRFKSYLYVDDEGKWECL